MKKRTIIIIAVLLVIFGVVMRLLPHAPNMTPIVALAFIGSMYLGRRWAIILPLTALLLSDILVGFYDVGVMTSVYLSFALIGLLSWTTKKYKSFLPVGVTVIGASFSFYIITNSAVWMFSPWYEKSISGLLLSYELGLPFLRNMIVGDVAYTLLLVGAFEGALALRRTRIFSKNPTLTYKTNFNK